MRKNEERTRQLQTVKVDAAKIRRALSEQGIPLTKASREMGYASDYLTSRLKEDGTVPVVVAQLLKYKYGIGREPEEEAEQIEEQIPGQLSIEDLERARRIEERVRQYQEEPNKKADAAVPREIHEQHVRDLYKLTHREFDNSNMQETQRLIGAVVMLARILAEDMGLQVEGLE